MRRAVIERGVIERGVQRRAAGRRGSIFVAAVGAVAFVLTPACSGSDEDRPIATESTTTESTTAAPTAGSASSSASAELFETICSGAPRIDEVGRIASSDITEASGLASSWANPGAWWVNNDSGDSARIFAIDDTGELLATVNLDDVEARDWESVALGPGATGQLGAQVFVGDTGDNAVMRDASAGRGSIRVHRFSEPVLDADSAPQELRVDVDTLTFEFPDDAHDVEAMLIDPVDGDLVVVTKDWHRTGESLVFRAPSDAAAGSTSQLEPVGSVPLEPGTLVTAADVTRDGALVALRSYGAVHLYERIQGRPLWSAFETVPCEGPVPTERQGESIGFAPDGGWYLTVSEGEHAALHRTS